MGEGVDDIVVPHFADNVGWQKKMTWRAAINVPEASPSLKRAGFRVADDS